MPTEATLIRRVESSVVADLNKNLPRIIRDSVARAMSITSAQKRPSDGTKCATVWSELDQLMKQKDEIPSLSEIQQIARRKRWNLNNTRVEYYNWRKANGIHGRLTTVN